MAWDGATWQEGTKTWIVRLHNVQTGEAFNQECNVVISAVGGLVNPNPCTIPGLDTFQGSVAHTARWRKDIIVDDKNVVVIGNGCSASQLVPVIASKAKNVYQFFRSSQYYFPRDNFTFHPVVKWAFRYIPFLLTFFRYLLFNLLELDFIQFQTDDRGNRRRQKAKQISEKYVEKTAPKEYWDLLKPTYEVGCKRRVYDPGYLESLHRDNVHITKDPIIKIEPTEVVTKSGKHYPADVIVRQSFYAPIYLLTPELGSRKRICNNRCLTEPCRPRWYDPR